jgi:predicted nucleic acid-binding protein
VAAPLITPDSSVLIAGATPGHQFYRQAAEVLPTARSKGRLIAHTMAETFSVLTRQSHSRPPERVLRYLDQFLEHHQPVGLTPASYTKILRTLAKDGVAGGAVYDGLIAAAARQAGLRLLSFDRRAARTYEAVNADYEILV